MRKIEPKKMTKAERLHLYYGVDAMRKFEHEMLGDLHQFKALPDAWDEIWDTRRLPKAKTRVTVRLDTDVVKFFKTLGPGYQPRMNDVLRAFMHFRLAKIVKGPDTTDYILHPERVMLEDERAPKWGDTARAVEE